MPVPPKHILRTELSSITKVILENRILMKKVKEVMLLAKRLSVSVLHVMTQINNNLTPAARLYIYKIVRPEGDAVALPAGRQ